jgi:hypothetical protein
LRRVPRPGRQQRQPEWPSLAGQHALYVTRQIDAFKAGTRNESHHGRYRRRHHGRGCGRSRRLFLSLKSRVGRPIPRWFTPVERLYRGGNRARA